MSNLEYITFTGADDFTDVQGILDISRRYPDVEWGILVSKKQVGSSRFPSLDWQEYFADLALSNRLNVSCHVCGSLVRDLLLGSTELITSPPPVLKSCQRMQLNFHAEPHEVKPDVFIETVKKLPIRQLISQYDGVNNQILDILTKANINAVPLFDLSHGAGVLPEDWPTSIGSCSGYAGGLTPDNILTQMAKIHTKLTPGTSWWLDTETGVRTNDQFDLNKVEAAIKNVKCYKHTVAT